MIRVTMDVFSGLPNPAWDMADDDSADLLARVIDGKLPVLDASFEVPLLGYRGFEVHATGKEARALRKAKVPTRFRISSVHPNADSFSNATESVLIESAGGAAAEEVLAHSLDRLVQIAKGSSGLALRESGEAIERWRPTQEPAESTEYGSPEVDASESGDHLASIQAAGCTVTTTSNNNFDFWNKDRNHRLNNNCYNYASNSRTNTFAQPARGGTGRAFWETKAMDVAGLQWGVAQDGWVTGAGCNRASYEIALVIWRNIDFHFYRRVTGVNGQSRWAHKPGQTAAKNTDNSGRIITSAFNCDRGEYKDWGGYRYHRSDQARNVR